MAEAKTTEKTLDIETVRGGYGAVEDFIKKNKADVYRYTKEQAPAVEPVLRKLDVKGEAV